MRVIAAAALLTGGCASAAPSAPAVSRGVAAVLPAVSAAPYEAGDTAFGLDVLRAWCQADPDQNLLFSPETLATGLGMAYLGARGATAQAIARVLHLPADGWTGVSLPYRGGKLSMIALLPLAGAAGCAVPDQAALNAIRAGGGTARGGGTVGIALPKVSLTTSGSMNSLLKTLGMAQASGAAADFSRLSPQACCIGFVRQAATLEVSEKGTVGAAASAVGIVPSAGIAIRGQTVVFDRPT